MGMCGLESCTKQFDLILGERRNVFFELSSANGTGEFVIMNATWELQNEKDESDYEEGYCTIHDHEVVCKICPSQIGTYLLTASCEVGDEIIKETAIIYVDKTRR